MKETIKAVILNHPGSTISEVVNHAQSKVPGGVTPSRIMAIVTEMADKKEVVWINFYITSSRIQQRVFPEGTRVVMQ